ncbi:hypothetical protein BC826DRAFT_88351 [Russula brevipes]|nr:hypothetical protein BC826DRAFT_88351 [Russula brevipes]
MAPPPIPMDRPDISMRPHSTPPRVHASREVEPSDPEREGRCSPLLGFFTGARGRVKQREHTQDSNSAKPVVGAPIIRTRTASREGPDATRGTSGALLPSFEFEHGGSKEARRSTSRSRHRRVATPHANGNRQAQSHAYSRRHAHTNSHGQDARSHTRTHARSQSHGHPARSHTHPQPSHHRGAGSPQVALHPPLMPSAMATSAASQSTTGTAATNTTGAPGTGGSGSWGRAVRKADWLRGAGVHPPFAFESAASSTASANGERRGDGGSKRGSGSDIRERERDRDRERTRRHVAQTHASVSPIRSAGSGPGRWEQREVELGLGLTWAPTKIRVREWTPGGVHGPSGGVGAADDGKDGDAQARTLQREREMERRVREREGERRTRERLAEYELGHARSRKDREVTGRFREVLGLQGFEAFRKYVRRYDADLIPLEGPSGLLGRVERLLDKTPTRRLGALEQRELLDDLVRIVRENDW